MLPPARFPGFITLLAVGLLASPADGAIGLRGQESGLRPSTSSVSGGRHPMQREVVRFERLEGLAHNTVFSLLQDEDGFLWIGTAGGLNRFDGSELKTYRHVWNDSTSLSDNTVHSLATDHDGQLWIGTANGLNRLDRLTDRFEWIHLQPEGRDADVAKLLMGSEQSLWVQTYGDHLYQIDPETLRLLGRWPSDHAHGEKSGVLIPRFVDRMHRIWITRQTAEDGTYLHAFDPAGASLREPRLGDPLPTAVALFPTNVTLYPGQSGPWAADESTVHRFYPTTAQLEPVLQLPETLSGHIRLLEARDGTLWIGTSAGIYHADAVTGDMRHYRLDTTGTASLSNYVLALYEDRAGAIWVGTRSGLFRYDPHKKPFVQLRPGDGLPRGENTGIVMAIEEDSGGGLWVGTLGGGLLRIDRLTGKTERYRHAPGDAYSLLDDRIWSLSRHRDGRLFIGTEAGLCVLDPRTGRFTRYRLPAPSLDTVMDGLSAVYAIAASRHDGLWIGRPWDLFLLDVNTGEVERHVTLRRRLEFSTIQTIKIGTDGTVWIGTEGAGLVRYDPKQDVATRVAGESSDAGERATGSADRVWSMRADNGTLWMGTDLGLVRFDFDTGSFEHFVDPERESASIVYSILEDDAKRLWMGTSHGLVRFDPRTQSFRYYDGGDGVGSIEFNRRAAVRTVDGTFYFGGLSGLTVFDPAAIRDNPYVPPVVVTAIRKTSPDGTESLIPELAVRDGLTLSHRDHVFSFAFSALNFTDSNKNRYAYLLDGYDNEWVRAGSHREARYTNVPPGTYTFRVKGANNDGVWNEEGASIRVTITPPFHATWWFRLLSLAAALSVVTGAYRYRVAQIRRVERLRLRIAADLHDDIGSRLSSIALMSEMVRDRAALTQDARDELTRIGGAARRLVDGLRDIVWFIDPNHDAEGALLRKMESTAGDMLHGMNYSFEGPQVGTHAFSDVQVKRNVFLIYKEALHNVARHAGAETVRISVRWNRGLFEFAVVDDGVGFDPDRPSEGHGLRNMRLRAEKIGARLDIDSRSGAGTTSRLRLNLR